MRETQGRDTIGGGLSKLDIMVIGSIIAIMVYATLSLL